ncbi:hypothetical protein MPSEU_000107000 [Mayamaea pseudoterrestris]|nr:hypothetical protein MPSEU_000107000 [Mayamaea pseudoterrestris]
MEEERATTLIDTQASDALAKVVADLYNDPIYMVHNGLAQDSCNAALTTGSNAEHQDEEAINGSMPLSQRKPHPLNTSAASSNQRPHMLQEPRSSSSKSNDHDEKEKNQTNHSHSNMRITSSPSHRSNLSPSSRKQLVHHRSSPHSQSYIVTLDQLSLREKLLLLTGSSLWTMHALPKHHLPSLTLSDGGHGVRKPLVETSLQLAHPATCFPPLCALACSWDESLIDQVGQAIAHECYYYQVSVLLGPGLNLKRHSCGGRNFEYFSEDPLLSGRLAASFIKGIQHSGHVAACPKHFAVNNQETHRFVVNALVDPRTARELYYKAFEICVKTSQPATIMCAYNKVNGTYASEHYFLQTQLLRQEWGFDGVCMTDWGATHDRAAGIKAGMDLEMPGSHGAHDRSIRMALKSGSESDVDGNNDEAGGGGEFMTTTLRMEEIDVCAERVLQLVQRYRATARATGIEVDWEQHAQLARQAARDSIVLLKNEDNLLPLARNTSVALIGDFAKDHPRIQGMGSAQVTPFRVETVYEEMQHYTNKITFAKGYDGDDDHPTQFNTELLSEAVEIAKPADVVLLFIGLPEIMEAEGMDREHMRLPAQHNALLNEVLAVNSNVVVVITNGGTVELPDCCDHAKAILEGYLLGQSGGGAMCDIIFGHQSPCGKLAETMPLRQADLLCDKYFPGDRDVVAHFEGLDVGYRYFNTANKRVRFPFGHGLSYTTFEFSNLQTTVELDDDNDKKVHVTLDLKNTGQMAAKEVVQLYVHDVIASVYRPFHELKAYAKVSLEPGETKTVQMSLDRDAFAFWDIGVDDWVVEAGEFEIQVGSSSQLIELRQRITFEKGQDASELSRDSYPPTTNGTLHEISHETFAKRFGAQAELILDNIRSRIASSAFDRNSMLKEIALVSLIGKLFVRIVFTEASREIKPGPSEQRQKKMIRANVENLPLRVLVLFSKGGLSFTLLDAIIAILNGYYCLAFVFLFYASVYAVKDTVLDLFGQRTP